MGIVEKAKDTAQNVTDLAIDGIEKLVTPAKRAGAVVNRAGAMSEGGVKHKVIALQMSECSPNGHQYSESFVDGLVNLYQDSKTKVVLTAEASTQLIKDQKKHGLNSKSEDLDDFITVQPILIQT